jgi:acyl transferase domain-containing protein
MTEADTDRIAIIGMAGRFPGAADVAELWTRCVAGQTSIRRLTTDELAAVDPVVRTHPGFVPVTAPLADVEDWDPEFFGFGQRDAEITDPQHRLFLECAWTALEDAGYDPRAYPGVAGVFAGCGFPSYLQHNLARRPDVVAEVGLLRIGLGNDRDTLTTFASYRLNLRGPSAAVQTACSTSLVAVHLACQSLLSYESDLMLAGGVAVHVPQQAGHVHEDGGLLSRDGDMRSLDARATGRVVGNGAGVVALKRLGDALRDGDHVYATVVGSAVNNDGGSRVGYAAPSVRGQAEAMIEAMASGGVPPESISFVEAHGTGTLLGDSAELEAVSLALTPRPEAAGPCHIGSVKPNVGHLDRAAGITGLIKTAMMLRHRTIPSQRGFVEPNPALDVMGHAFAVSTRGTGWEPPGGVRRALVNAFGLGGSNAVVVLEEAPALPPRETAGGPQLLVLSARDRAALDDSSRRLADHLAGHPDLDLADVAFTLQSGRTAFGCRRVLVAADLAGAVRSLRDPDAEGVRSRDAVRQGVEVAVVVPDALATDPEAGALLSAAEPAFRAHLADGFRPALKALLSSLGADVEVVAGDPDGRPALTGRLTGGDPGRVRSAVLDVIGQLWLTGAEIGWSELHPGKRRRLPLPTYPFQRRRCWVEPGPGVELAGIAGNGGGAVPLTGGRT